ncbi:MAG: ATP-dependent DNA helicase [Chloroflexota bacterium]
MSDRIADELGHEPTEGQTRVIELLSEFITLPSEPGRRHAFLLKGYAGTGKTTLVSALVRVLPVAGLQSVLLAPTGRAAKVLAGYARKQANTIHRKIYRAMTGDDGRLVMMPAPNPHKLTLFIVDESSMIQGPGGGGEPGIYSHRDLLEDLIEYVYRNEGCKLLLIGDNAQLPPVGLNESPAMNLQVLQKNYHLDVSTFELNEVVRQSLYSGILSNATLLRAKTELQEPRPPFFNVKGFKDIKSIDGAEFEDALNSCYSRFGMENTVIITRSNKRANLFNNEVRSRLLFRETELSAGDIMMVTKNNYFWIPISSKAGFIANGDIIEVRRILRKWEMYGYHFADMIVQLIDYPDMDVIEIRMLLESINVEKPSMPAEEMTRLYEEIMLDYTEVPGRQARVEKVKNDSYYNAVQAKFAYALTCHKTQGGQWDAVFIDMGYLKEEMLDSSFLRWLYTAVTRATKELYLVNFKPEFFE